MACVDDTYTAYADISRTIKGTVSHSLHLNIGASPCMVQHHNHEPNARPQAAELRTYPTVIKN